MPANRQSDVRSSCHHSRNVGRDYFACMQLGESGTRMRLASHFAERICDVD